MHRQLARFVVFAVAVSLVGCKKGIDPNASVRSDSSGLETVLNSGRYKPIRWAFDTVFTIGGAGDSAFQRVREHTIQVSPAGNIFVLDTDTRNIDVYDSTGARVKRIVPDAKNGIKIPSALVLQPNGFAVYDVDKPALVKFTEAGEYVGTAPAPRQYREGMLRNDSTALIIAQRVRDPKTDTPVMSIVRITETDTSSIIAAQIVDAMSVNLPMCGGVNMMLEPFFADPPAWTSAHGVTAVSETPLYGIRLYRGTKEFRRVRRNLQPEEASNQYAVLAAGPGKQIRSLDGTVCTIPPVEVARAAGWRDKIPAIAKITLRSDGGMWVQRLDPGHSHPAVDVFDPTGEYVGTLPMNTPWPIGFLPNGNAVVLAEDSAGMTHIAALKINTAGAAAGGAAAGAAADKKSGEKK